MIGASKVGPRVRELAAGRVEVDINRLAYEVYGLPARELRPVHVAIVECELAELDFRRPRGGSSIWQR
jgi:hypothetical protein